MEKTKTTIGKDELSNKIKDLFEGSYNKKDIKAIVDGFASVVKTEVAKGNKVQIVGFGTFESASRAERDCRNPQTGETVHVASKKVPRFKAGTDFVNALNA